MKLGENKKEIYEIQEISIELSFQKKSSESDVSVKKFVEEDIAIRKYIVVHIKKRDKYKYFDMEFL